MKKIIILFMMILSTVSYSQTNITDANFQTAINTCLSTNPEDGLCSDSEYGAMPDWDVSQVTDMSNAFQYRVGFNGDISNWDVSSVTRMDSMFEESSSFNQPIGDWDVSNVTSMYAMFSDASSFNQPLNDWNTSSVIYMGQMFFDEWNSSVSPFNQDLNSWDVSNVIDMSGMFNNASSFNGDISDWDVSNVTNMGVMFQLASSFNQPIGDWDTSSVTNMVHMFDSANSFNQPLNDWNTSSVIYMEYIFKFSESFDQPLNNWDITNISDMSGMFNYSGLSTDSYDATLIGWSEQNINSDPAMPTSFGALGVNYCNGEDARQNLIDNYGWIITDAGLDCSTASVDYQNQLDISIYPNPSSDTVYIDGNYSQLKVVMYDILGKQVMNKPITNTIDISQLEKGVYILQLSDGAKLTTQRIVKN